MPVFVLPVRGVPHIEIHIEKHQAHIGKYAYENYKDNEQQKYNMAFHKIPLLVLSI